MCNFFYSREGIVGRSLSIDGLQSGQWRHRETRVRVSLEEFGFIFGLWTSTRLALGICYGFLCTPLHRHQRKPCTTMALKEKPDKQTRARSPSLFIQMDRLQFSFAFGDSFSSLAPFFLLYLTLS